MFKKSAIALVTLAAIGAAVPAFADTNSVFGTDEHNQINVIRNSIAEQLSQKGIKASNIDAWGNYIQADVTLANGNTVIRYFQPGSLKPVPASEVN